jgi:nucleotide-binding universal stress UspA family protein
METMTIVAATDFSDAARAERMLGSVPANMLVNAPTDVLIVP